MTVSTQDICTALHTEHSSLRCSDMARVNKGHKALPTTHTCIHNCNEPSQHLLPNRRASPHFGRYSFPITL